MKPTGKLILTFTATEEGIAYTQETDCNGSLIFQVLLDGLPEAEDKLGRMLKYRAAEVKKGECLQ